MKMNDVQHLNVKIKNILKNNTQKLDVGRHSLGYIYIYIYILRVISFCVLLCLH